MVGISVLHLLVFSEGGTTEPSVLTTFIQQTTGMDDPLATVVANTASEVIAVLSEIGVMILLFEIGLESDLEGLLRVGPQAAIVAVGGVVAPFTAGTLGLVTLFHVDLVPAIFAGAALTATSIGITAKVLAEIQRLTSRKVKSSLGQPFSMIFSALLCWQWWPV